MTATGLITGDDGRERCFWHANLPDYLRYHDEEWGRPVTDDIRLFEKICLEGFQSGLSWLTILRKRDNFRHAFAGFDFHQVALFGEADIERCVADAGIIRHRGKIVSTVNNARRAIELKEEFGSLARYFWSHEPKPDERPAVVDRASLSANPTTPTSVRLSKDLKKRGWTFVGPTTIYAFMQAMGLVNDHLEGCYCRDSVEKMRNALVRP
ncbi:MULTISPECIES: DNA-3-methyladenine glycosylase I [unclassified Rhizobium]|uniref:DNA-3-methyladenine glycosylase I n=1 Tax=unclassified Rhizobium TaxID=2613769 RepID=UPI001ADAE5F5|nr:MULTISPECIES: DNA-3-methyladenine glycosylase I [unclassified Rhizobium]MBO9097377.1 DNA-3-methyladenine glycosylase I [Rhizobium sp. L58/93]MBO9133771.1 DNA-3-methyladenine glycosylase I [Rhizobium sp. B209b/85]MBO9167616.1 DNA-3-methyladenine glycosylase I [Rhizobium sp. L245/93]MBO9183575.1 DNA-3-methyladenine glycosylase I [Rhizobium sp. E27B/91]QXZ83901.1 DNA-3-methyladenine glycosylase I [Rhizobium sp. K1/93]